MFVERMYMNFRISYINNITFLYLLHPEMILYVQLKGVHRDKEQTDGCLFVLIFKHER